MQNSNRGNLLTTEVESSKFHLLFNHRVLYACKYFTEAFFSNLSEKSENKEGDKNKGGSVDDLDLPLLDFSTITTATDNFSMQNKIGEGGFGPVYRVIHSLGARIATFEKVFLLLRVSQCT